MVKSGVVFCFTQLTMEDTMPNPNPETRPANPIINLPDRTDDSRANKERTPDEIPFENDVPKETPPKAKA